MQFDVARYLGAVTRTVEATERDGKAARIVTLQRSYTTTQLDLWDAVTNPERLPRWFLPVSGELKLGGRYQFEGNAGGTITTCDRPQLVAGTWEFAGAVSWVEARIAPDGGEQARLTLAHTCPIGNEHWDTYGPGAVGIGWELGLMGLALYLEGYNPTEAMDPNTFHLTPEGKALITGSGEDWARAAIAGGDDPEWAERSARITIGFYTGVPVEG